MTRVREVQEQARERIAAARHPDDVEPDGAKPDGAGVLIVERAEPSVDEGVPRGVRTAAAWAWRVLVLVAAGYVLMLVLSRLTLVVIPLAVALLLAALLQPASAALRAAGVPPSLAAAIVLVGGLAVVGGVLTAVINAFINGVPDLVDQVQQGIDEIRDWLVSGPLHVSQDEIDRAVSSAQRAITDNQGALTEGAVSTATTAAEVIAAFFLVLFATFFLLKDGDTIWQFLVQLLPRAARPGVFQAGRHAWRTLISYVRATVFVAFVDALGIGLGAYFVGVPLALPIAALVFLGAFIPVVGATLSGTVAVLVALVAKGPIAALVMLGIVIGVQQLEGHVLQPLIMGRAVAVHPLAVIVGIASGAVLAGIVGALVAVPIIATMNTAIRYLAIHPHGDQPSTGEPPGTADKGQAPAEAGGETAATAADAPASPSASRP